MNNKSLTKNIILLFFLSLVLKGLGFVNRILIAYYYGASELTDVFYNSTGFIESIVATLTASLNVAIANVYLENKKEDNNLFVSSLVNILSILMLVLIVLVCFSSSLLSKLLAPGYSSEESALFARTLWILSLTLPLQTIIAVYSSVLQAEKEFTPVKLTGAISSALTIVCVVILSKQSGINALVISYILGTIVNAWFLSFRLRGAVHYSPKINVEALQWKKMLKLMIPLLIATAAHEINLIVDRSIASKLSIGAISALSYSCVLFLFIENVIINSLVMAVFPELKEQAIEKNNHLIASKTNTVIFIGELLLIPITTWTVLNATDITRIIYMRGSFDNSSLNLTSLALVGYTIGLPFLAIRNISMQVFYANNNTKTPVKYNLIATGLNIVLDFILSYYWGIIGITIATSISIAISALFLFKKVSLENKSVFDRKMKHEYLILLIASIVSGLFYFFVNSIIVSFTLKLLTFLVGILLEVAILALLKSQIIYSMFNSLNKMIKR